MREGWRKAVLGDAASFDNGFPFKPSELGTSGMPVIRIKQLLNPQEIPDRSEVDVPIRFQIDNGDLIFSWSATLAVRIWDRGRAILNQHLFKVTPAEGMLKAWLAYTLENAIADLEHQAHGTTMKHITKKRLTNYQIAIPPPANKNESRILSDLLTTTSPLWNSSCKLAKLLVILSYPIS